jgi:trehalose 6-phosphate synthase/phosphatase
VDLKSPLQQIHANAGAKLPATPNNSIVNQTLNKATAPVPVDATQKPPAHPLVEGMKVNPKEREQLEEKLSSGRHGRVVPVWLSDAPEEPEDTILLKDSIPFSTTSSMAQQMVDPSDAGGSIMFV